MTKNIVNTSGAEASGKAIDALIAKVAPSYAKSHAIVQEAALAIVRHAKEYGDCTRAKTLVRAIPIQQARSLIQYFMSVSPIGILMGKTSADDKVRFLKPESKAYNNFDLAKAEALSWWLMDAEQTAKELQVIHYGGVFDEVDKLLNRITENKSKAKKYDAEAIQAASMLAKVVQEFRVRQGYGDKAVKEEVAPTNDATDGLPVGLATE